MSKLWVVIRQVYRKNVKSGSFIFMVLSPLIFIGIIAAVAYFVSQSETSSPDQIAVVDADPGMVEVLKTMDNHNVDFNFDQNQDQARQALADGEVDGMLKLNQEDGQLKATYYGKSNLAQNAKVNLQQTLSQYQMMVNAQEAGISPDQLQSLMTAQVPIEEVSINVKEDGSVAEENKDAMNEMGRNGVASIAAFIIFYFLMFFINIIIQEVAAEKGSRIMEIILSSIPAKTHFYGKLLGVVLMILTQVGIYVLLFILWRILSTQFGILSLPEEITQAFDIKAFLSNNLTMLLISGLLALMGIVTYIALAAFLGSLVTKTEDAQKVSQPVIWLGLIGFYIGIFGQQAGTDTAFYRISSQIPFFTPFVMPFRLADHSVEWPGVIMAIVVSLITMVLIFIFATSLYKSNVLAYSDKGPWDTFKQSISLWKSERQVNTK
ncbi:MULTISPECIES: ABC transporter permease [Aerococcus]|uniref:ABC transporter permease n=1 Tax=Aerococcus TaxID=1375 RepID=UPI0018A78083|nr:MULTISPECIES: ABC transporter permease [Aerococcus]MCY3036686.1 ABC transporter permease [Aerococcus sp. Group 2]MCY3039923.1 ABC transporter permease [Aerococcus sp. Group 2]MCY3041733.1 ABC transporter permease [Aerococcus sp. Group 2]MCY3043380.1 ABC transporter permease [Aerococcus sp. Group 2]MDK6521134.1 ABC transporter permease [Aerococcus urinae]